MATITCGILIALGLEQSIEWMHRQGEIAEARQAVRSEIAANAGQARVAVEEERCIATVMDRLIAWGNGGPPPAAAFPKRPWGFAEPSKGAWETVRTGAVAHMPLTERLAYTKFYDRVYLDLSNSEIESAPLRRLLGQAAKAQPATIDMQRVVEDAAQARFTATLRVSEGLVRLGEAKAMGILPPPLTPAQRDDLAVMCGYAAAMSPTAAP